MKKRKSEAATMIDEMLDGLPELNREWTQYQLSEEFTPDAPYVHAAFIGQQVVEIFRASRFTELGRFFFTIETLLEKGSPEQRDLIASGLLESIQNQCLDLSIPLQAWHRFLGPQSRHAWDAVIGFWSGVITGEEFNRRIAQGTGSTA